MWAKLNFISLMCLLSFAGVLVCAADGDEKMTLDDMIATLEGIGASCDPVPTKEMIKEILLHEENPQRGSKCFARCIMEMFEMQTADSNLLNEEKIIEFSNVMYQDKEADIRTIIKSCNTKNAGITDRCDVTHEHSMCMLREAKERDFEIPVFTK